MSELRATIVRFVDEVLASMGLTLEIAVEESAESVRIDLRGEGGDLLVRRRGEGLEALQHIANTAFRPQLSERRRILIDCMDFRRGQDSEVRQMAKFLADRAKSTGTPQEIGPLNSYSRRLVHMAVAEDPEMTSESIGDASMKTVIISMRDPNRGNR